MKTSLTFLFVVLLFFTSCDNQKMVVTSGEIIGTWRSDNLVFRSAEDGEELIWGGAILTIAEDSTYYKNFVSGRWEFLDNELILKSREDLEMESQSFKVKKVSETEMKLQIKMTEGEYCCDFEEFKSDELLVITESFRKDE